MTAPYAYWTRLRGETDNPGDNRCLACQMQVEPDESVHMTRVGAESLRLLHERCDKTLLANGRTALEQIERDGMRYLASLGWRGARRWLAAQSEAEPRSGTTRETRSVAPVRPATLARLA